MRKSGVIGTTLCAIVVVLCALAPSAWAAGGDQAWLSRYDGPGLNEDVAHSVAVSPDGKRTFVSGTSKGASGKGQDYGTVAYDSATGAQLWVARYDFRAGSAGVDREVAMTVSQDGTRVFVTGESGNGPVVTTVAYDAATGAQVWVARSTIGATPAGMVASRDGKRVFVVVGSDLGDYGTIAYDATTGAQLWTAFYDGAQHRDDFAAAIAVSPDGTRVFVTGDSNESGTPRVRPATTIAYDAATGHQLWIDRLSDGGDGHAHSVSVSPDGARIYVTGSIGFGTLTTWAYDAASGARVWTNRRAGSTGSGSVVAASADGTRVFVLGGTAPPNPGDPQNFTTLAYDAASGTALWESRYTSPAAGQTIPRSLALDPAGRRVYVTGVTPGTEPTVSFGVGDYATVAYDAASGAQAWVARYNGPANRYDAAYSVAVNRDGTRVFVTGGVDQLADYGTIAYDSGLAPAGPSRRAGGAAGLRRRTGPCPA